MGSLAAEHQVSLDGEWLFRLDPLDTGIADKWYLSDLPERISLPGSTDEHLRGIRNDKVEPRRLTRAWEFVGAAWYQRDIEIPTDWSGKRILVFLERCHWESQAPDLKVGIDKDTGIAASEVHVGQGLNAENIRLIVAHLKEQGWDGVMTLESKGEKNTLKSLEWFRGLR